jgi:thiol:disulfide interchange protein DsbC
MRGRLRRETPLRMLSLQPMKPVHARMAGGLILLLSVAAAWVTSRSQTAPAATSTSSGPAPAVSTQSVAPPGADAIPNGGISPVSPGTATNAPAALGGTAGAPDGVAPTPVPGIVEVRRGADIVYMSSDGKYVFTGDLYQVSNHKNLTEARQRDLRRSLIDSVPESQMLVFSPPKPKYTITVFTDVDCVYCRAFHKQIATYNQLGVRVRYVFFPRTGPNTESWYKAEQVWCSADRKAALTRAKLGEGLSAKICGDNPVARDYALGAAIGLEGTPGIVASNGAMLGGYLAPDALLAALQLNSQAN